MKIEKKPLILNLQLFSELAAEPDDFSLDDTDFTDIPTEDTENQENTDEVDNISTDENVENVEENPQELPFLNIKYNKEEMALTQEQAVELAQKGMNYDKIIERLYQAENNPALQYLNELAERNGTTTEDLVQYWREQERQAELNHLVQANIPEEYAQEILENRKFRQQMQEQQQAQAERERQRAEYTDFFNSFPNVKPEEIPVEVWQKTENGVPLKYAYMEYNQQKLLSEINILKNNQKNKQKSPLGNGIGNTNADDFDPFDAGFNSYGR